MITGTYTKWSDWSNCEAPDCENNPNYAVMTRTQTNVDDPTDVKTQEIPCQSPCPPGGTKEYNYDIVQPPTITTDCSVLEANVKQTPIGYKYFIEEAVKKPKTENISQVILVGYKIFLFF